MIRSIYEHAAFVDSAAVIALLDDTDANHEDAINFMKLGGVGLPLFALNLTSHECFTRIRYKKTTALAMEHYSYLRSPPIDLIRFEDEDENKAHDLLIKFSEHSISFHDALCAAAMMRTGVFKIFTFDKDFYTLGFQLLPGNT